MSWFPSGPPEGARRVRRVAAMAAALIVTAGLAACGDASGTGAASGDDGSCAAPGVTDSSVKVALISPFTGPSASSFAGYADAAQARIDKFNAGGGLNGRTIETVREDDMGDGAAQTIAARAAVQEEQVFGIIAASRIDTMYDYLHQQGVPVTGLMTPLPYAEDDNVFGYAGGSNIGWASTALMQRLKDAGGTNIAIRANNSPAAVNGANAAERIAQQLGFTVGVKVVDIPLGSFDATAQAIQIKEAGVDTIYAATLADSSVSVIRALAAQGVKPKAAYLFGVYDPAVDSQVSADIQGITASATGLRPTQVDTPEMETYLADMAQYAPGIAPTGNFTSGGYIAADLFIRGLEEAGDCMSRESFITGLRGVSDYNGAGLIVPDSISFNGGPSPNGATPYDKCQWFVSREGEQWIPDAEPTCGDLVELT
jgi:branched-chain amino acid transport system substrate-binding protein